MIAHPIILYDGLCAFCNWTTRLIIRLDTKNQIRFASLQGAIAKPILARHPELHGVDSLVFVEGDCGSVKSRAVLRLIVTLGGVTYLALPFFILPRVILDFGYDGFARIRYRVFGKYDTCPIPPRSVRERFLD